MQLVLFVGMPSSIELLHRPLAQLRPQLRRHGVAYIGPSEISRMKTLSAWRGDARPTGSANVSAREFTALVRAEQRRTVGHPMRVLIASERLLGGGLVGRRDAPVLRPFAAAALGQVLDALDVHDARILLHTHRQDKLLEHAHLKRLRDGCSTPFEEFLPAPDRASLDYCDLVGRLRSLPRVGEVQVRPVELAEAGIHAFTNDVLASVDLADRLDLDVLAANTRNQPPVYTNAAAHIAVAVNPLLESGADIRAVHSFLAGRYLAADLGPGELFTREQRQQILDAYAGLNQDLFTEHLPDLPSDSYADDVATFALGNALSQPGAVHAERNRAHELSFSLIIAGRRIQTRIEQTGKLARRRLGGSAVGQVARKARARARG